MALDTLGFITPAVKYDVFDAVCKKAELKRCVDMFSGEMKYEFITVDLRDSSDHRISIKVLDKMWTKEIGEKTPSLKSSEIYLKIETSIHKQMLGHNILGGSSDLYLLTKWLSRLLEKELDVKLPDFNEWWVYRIDVAEAWNLESLDAVIDWFRLVNNCEFTRRQEKVNKYFTGLYFPGSTTTWKAYGKGPEFRKHDRKIAKKILDFITLSKLQDMADSVLRIEVEIHKKKLKDDFGGRLPFVYEITKEYLDETFNCETNKILKGLGEGMQAVRNKEAVQNLLYEKFESHKAGILLGTWFRLAADGEKAVRITMPKSTFQWQKKQILDAGCSWVATDVVIGDTKVPLDFKPVRSDRHYIAGVLEQIQEMLNEVA